MSRSARETASRIFDGLVTYAADRDSPIPVGERFIFLTEQEYGELTETKRTAHLKFGRHQAAALVSTATGEVLAFAGFDAEELTQSTHMREIEPTNGLLVACLADLDVDPSVVSAVVRNVVGAGRKGDADYVGHDLAKVLTLYPRIRILEIDGNAGGEGNFLPNVLAACAREGASGNGWMNAMLAEELELLGEQRVAGLPYEFLVRSALDLNPTNLFLSLYRCLEATYAFTKASDLSKALGVTKPWTEIAVALGSTLNWYPRHDQSLLSVLSMPTISNNDLVAVADILSKSASADTVAARAASGIRDLRNSLVHYGPTTRSVGLPDSDWNDLCVPLSRIVGGVFLHAYGSPGNADQPDSPAPAGGAVLARTSAPVAKPGRIAVIAHMLIGRASRVCKGLDG